MRVSSSRKNVKKTAGETKVKPIIALRTKEKPEKGKMQKERNKHIITGSQVFPVKYLVGKMQTDITEQRTT